MKCPNCGEEISKNEKTCSNCGQCITAQPKKKKIWLWILGWLCIFPLPLTILLLRKKNMKAGLKYGIIAAAWILYLILGAARMSNNNTDTDTVKDNKPSVEQNTDEVKSKPPETEEKVKEETTAETETVSDTETLTFIIDPNEKGEYGFENTLNAGTEFEETKIVYHIPVGKYSVKYIGDYSGQLSVCSDETHKTDEDWEEPASTGDVALVDSDKTAEITVPEGYYVEINANGKIEFTLLGEATEKTSTGSNDELKKKIEDDQHLTWFGNVRNDVTGNWRLSEYASSNSLETFALDYYNAYFENNKEIHAVINMTTKVTGKVSVLGDIVDVTLYEYIDGEEHDAKVLFGGTVLKEYWITMSTGEIEEIQ